MAQINTTVGDLEGNTDKILSFIEKAREHQTDLITFPEMAVTGYPPEDLLFHNSFIESNIEKMHDIVAASIGMTVVVGFVSHSQSIFNSAAIGHNGKLVTVYNKIFLPNYGVFDEERYFAKGSECPVIIVNGISVGVNICEDIWYEYGPTNVQKSNGAELIVNINASPYHAGKRTFRENMIRDRALNNKVFVSYTNLVGGQDELVFDGSSLVIGPSGDLLARGKQFQEDLVITDIYFGTPVDIKPSTTNPPEDIGTPKIIRVDSQINTGPKESNASEIFEPMDNLTEIYSALVLGTRDYVRKCGFEKVVIGLSGGIDSSLTAAIAVKALGKDNVVGITMPSRYSSDGSVVDAEYLARNLGIEIMTVSIEETFTSMLNMLAVPFKNKEPNVAEENLQTRIRGNILMGISNKFGWMVLTTGNKSEMASGYATLYGDMAGGFAVIKDVPKTLVYELCKHINLTNYPTNIIPNSVIEKTPSAELKHDQTDQDILPPYEILDPIIQAYVEEDMSYKNIVKLGFDAETVKTVIAMINRNEYKRRQAPPGVKITPRAFGRDRRFPIVNQYRDC